MRIGISLAVMFVALATAGASESRPASPDVAGQAPMDRFNYILGTQTIGVKYQFTQATKLVETAQRILNMGSNHSMPSTKGQPPWPGAVPLCCTGRCTAMKSRTPGTGASGWWMTRM